MALWLTLLLALISAAQTSVTPSHTVSGPAHGSLVLVGGGRTQSDIMRRFTQLAGGPAHCGARSLGSAHGGGDRVDQAQGRRLDRFVSGRPKG